MRFFVPKVSMTAFGDQASARLRAAVSAINARQPVVAVRCHNCKGFVVVSDCGMGREARCI